jgi:hypothetical protein
MMALQAGSILVAPLSYFGQALNWPEQWWSGLVLAGR